MLILNSSMNEEAFKEHLAKENYQYLSEWLVNHALDRLNKNDIHPYLRKQTFDACEEILNKNKEKKLSYNDYLRGTLLATKIITMAIPNTIEAYVPASYKSTYYTSQSSDAPELHQIDS